MLLRLGQKAEKKSWEIKHGMLKKSCVIRYIFMNLCLC